MLCHGFLSTGPGPSSQRQTSQSQDTGFPSLKCTRIQAPSPLETLLSPLQQEDCLLVSWVGTHVMSPQIFWMPVICKWLFTWMGTLSNQRHALLAYVCSYTPTTFTGCDRKKVYIFGVKFIAHGGGFKSVFLIAWIIPKSSCLFFPGQITLSSSNPWGSWQFILGVGDVSALVFCFCVVHIL